MSLELKIFYIYLQRWVDAGMLRENTFVFSKEHGICSNLERFFHRTECTFTHENELLHELKSQFIHAGLHMIFPFNEGKAHIFHNERCQEKTWENPQRLAWVKSHAEEK